MRVSKTTTTGSGPVQKRSGSGQGSSTFKVDNAGPSAPVAGAHSVQSVAPISDLLALQEVPDHAQGRKKAIRRANDMLDLLEEIRLDLLAGLVPGDRLSSLLDLVKTQRNQVHDPRLAHVLDEIELRAKVELAKAGHTV